MHIVARSQDQRLQSGLVRSLDLAMHIAPAGGGVVKNDVFFKGSRLRAYVALGIDSFPCAPGPLYESCSEFLEPCAFGFDAVAPGPLGPTIRIPKSWA